MKKKKETMINVNKWRSMLSLVSLFLVYICIARSSSMIFYLLLDSISVVHMIYSKTAVFCFQIIWLKGTTIAQLYVEKNFLAKAVISVAIEI